MGVSPAEEGAGPGHARESPCVPTKKELAVHRSERLRARTAPGPLRGSPLFVLFAALALVLAACGGGQGGQTSGAPGGGASASGGEASASGGEASESGGEPSESGGEPSESGGEAGGLEPPASQVSLDFWTPFTGGDGDTMEKLVEQFNSETPNVQIAIQRLPEYYTQINNAAAANGLPDVMIMHIDQLALYAANGTVQPVADLSEQLGLSADDFTEADWNGTLWKGEQYSIPLDVHTATLYYNKALFTQAGLDPESPPSDKASFEDALTKCKAAGITGPTWSNHFFSASLLWASLFYQGGGEWTNEDYTEATFNSEAGVNASNYMRGLIEQGLQPQDVEPDAEVPSFQAGESCMAITGIWQTNPFQEALGEDFGAAPIPKIFGNGVWAGSHTLAVRKGLEGDELQGAYYFIDWLTSHSLDWAKGGQIPARVSVREDPAFAEIPDVPDIAAQVDDARFPPPIPGSADFLGGPGGVTEKLLETLVNGGDPKPGLDQAAQTYTDAMLENKDKYGF
jgi:multiple sugar transport system substrate-binding protein